MKNIPSFSIATYPELRLESIPAVLWWRLELPVSLMCFSLDDRVDAELQKEEKIYSWDCTKCRMTGLLLHFRGLRGLRNDTWNLKPPQEMRWKVWDPLWRQPARTVFQRLHLGLQKEKCREQIPQKRQRDETFPRHNAPDMAPHFESHHSVDSSHSSCLLSKDSYQTRGGVLNARLHQHNLKTGC